MAASPKSSPFEHVLDPTEASARVQALLKAFGKPEGSKIKITGIGAGSWGTVFVAILKELYATQDNVEVRLWRRAGKKISKESAEQLMQVINSREDILRRMREDFVYLKYVEARLGDRVLEVDEVLRDGFCMNIVDCPVCPMKVVTDLESAVYDADIIIYALPSTETRRIFEQISKMWKATRKNENQMPVIVSLSKGVETRLEPHPHIITPTGIIHEVTGVPKSRILYLGGPNIAREIWRGKYATARICGTDVGWRSLLARFFCTPNFVVWENSDVITHEVMGGLKNVYAIGMGIVGAVTEHCATSKAVYFSNVTAEMVFITRMLSERPDDLQGPLLADTYVTLLKGRNAWYGEQCGLGKRHPADGDTIPGKGKIQGVSAVREFCALFRSNECRVKNHNGETVSAMEMLPTMTSILNFLACQRDEVTEAADAFIRAMKDGSATDPAIRLNIKDIYLPFLTEASVEPPSASANS